MLTFLLLLSVPLRASDADELSGRLRGLDAELRAARRDYDDSALAEVQRRLVEVAEAHASSYEAQALAAESYLLRANLLRNDRTIRDLERSTVKEYRSRQAEWGAAGLPYAERATELATSAAERARAERIVGELYVHQISGPIAGFIKGPQALAHVEKAVAEAPDDPECQRAIGLMYLYNPPINGGDVPRAIRTFRRCTELVPDSDEYWLYLALAFRKKGNLIRAEMAARKSLLLNPKSKDAERLVAVIQQQQESLR